MRIEYITVLTGNKEAVHTMGIRLGQTLPVTALGVAALFASVCALGHHAFSAEFEVSRPVKLTGTVVEIEWTNPHAWMHIEAKDEEGIPQRWAIELVGINGLVRFGFTRKTVKIGDILTVAGFGARNGSNTANASSVTRTETSEVLWASQPLRN
ncbi:MAG: hypothetical protein ACI9UU_002198 [Candidatus Azotimanducaceae bacterium]